MMVWSWIFVGVFLGFYFFGWITERLHLKALEAPIASQLQDRYSSEQFEKTKKYLHVNTNFHLLESGIGLVFFLGFFILGGFGILDYWVRSWTVSFLWAGLSYVGLLFLGSKIFSIPFEYYHTFFIEERFGFNRMDRKTFFLDQIKSFILAILLGAILFGALLWFFEWAGSVGWLWAWVFIVVFQFFLTFIAPVTILPLFNKFTPLSEGELRTKIFELAKKMQFHVSQIYTMDGSRRSTKANAFFTGFGKYRRIVFYDTLLEKHSVREIIAILAHEMGHYKKGHIWKSMVFSVASTGVMLYVFSLFLKNLFFLKIFQITEPTVYASLVVFSMLWIPVSKVISMISLFFSRKHEFEADEFSAKMTQDPDALILGLKKLHIDHLSHPNPHWLKVVFEYSHPPVLRRILALKKHQKV